MSMSKKIKLGSLIAQRREKNSGEGLPICGVSKDGFIPPKQIEADTSIYNMFYFKDFVFNPARMELNSIVFNDIYSKAICSSLYEMFYVTKEDIILPEYLALIIKTKWFTEYCDFLSNGSAREYCRVSNISDMYIDVPSINEQKDIVEKNKRLVKRINILENENEKLISISLQLLNKYLSKYPTKLTSINDIGVFYRGKNITAEEMVDGNYDVISAGLNPSGIHNEWNVEGPSITVSASGANAGFVSFHFDKIWAADCSYCNDSQYLIFLYLSLKLQKEKIDVFKDGHTGQQHVYAKNINELEIPVFSNREDFDEFTKKVNILFEKIKFNIKEIKILKSLKKSLIESLLN